ncbi:MAG: hypothetical protein ACEROO_11475, partial [Candidatus Bathyarchaeota archaeon]
MSKMSIFKTIANIDRRYYYAGVFLLTIILLLFPLGLPLLISPEVQNAYDTIDSLEPGDLVIINFCLSAS